MRRRILIFTASAALVIAGLVLLAARPLPPLKVAAAFVDYTNHLDGVRFARIRVTNHSGVRIIRGAYCYVYGQEIGLHPPMLGSEAFLASGQSEIIDVPAPTNHVRWRAGIEIGRDSRHRQFCYFVCRLPPPIRRHFPASAQLFHTEVTLTGWIDPVLNVTDWIYP